MLNYYKDEPRNPLSSNYKTSITEKTYNVGDGDDGYDVNKNGKNETKIFVPLKHLSNFWRRVEMSLINCEIELILLWDKILF